MELLCPKWLLCMDGSRQALENHAVLIDQDTIVDVGPTKSLQSAYPQATVTKLDNQLLMPGLINCHTHTGMTLLRGAADDLALHEWLQNRIWPLEGELADEHFVFDGTVLACAEMLLGGTTTFNDMYFFPESTVSAATQLGARVMAGIIAIEFPTRYGSGPDEYIEKSLATRDQYKDNGLVHWSVAPHA
ncbi:MAG: amidohydrolase family protein, partial [Limnobacter sp.]|nr:amidohydrolase family protein [Limnobacter sp.]